MLDVRDCIEPAIKKSGMKKISVAEQAGLSQQQMSDIIGKRRRLDSNELVSICNVLHITPNEMLGLGVVHGTEPELAGYEPRLPEGGE